MAAVSNRIVGGGNVLLGRKGKQALRGSEWVKSEV
jgi:hypothetical protein